MRWLFVLAVLICNVALAENQMPAKQISVNTTGVTRLQFPLSTNGTVVTSSNTVQALINWMDDNSWLDITTNHFVSYSYLTNNVLQGTNWVTTSNILDGTIISNDLAQGAISYGNLSTGAINSLLGQVSLTNRANNWSGTNTFDTLVVTNVAKLFGTNHALSFQASTAITVTNSSTWLQMGLTETADPDNLVSGSTYTAPLSAWYLIMFASTESDPIGGGELSVGWTIGFSTDNPAAETELTQVHNQNPTALLHTFAPVYFNKGEVIRFFAYNKTGSSVAVAGFWKVLILTNN